MKVIKSLQLKKVIISLQYISPNCYGVFVGSQRASKVGTYSEVDVNFCNAVTVLLEVKNAND